MDEDFPEWTQSTLRRLAERSLSDEDLILLSMWPDDETDEDDTPFADADW